MNILKHLMEIVQQLKTSLAKSFDEIISAEISGQQLWQVYDNVLNDCGLGKHILSSLNLLPIEPNYHLNADKGPGSCINSSARFFIGLLRFFSSIALIGSTESIQPHKILILILLKKPIDKRSNKLRSS